jgi:hypothetical protein
MSGHPQQPQGQAGQGHYDEGYGQHQQGNTDSYYQDDHGQPYYDNNDGYGDQHHPQGQHHQGGDGYYDESFVILAFTFMDYKLTKNQGILQCRCQQPVPA